MRIDSKEFGSVDIDQKQILHFAHGIYSFEDHKEWALLDTPQKPFYVMQSLSDAQISFILINPYLICDTYMLDIMESDIDLIGNPQAEALLVFTIVTIRRHPRMISANLAGPILINRHLRCGVQAIQQDTKWDTRFPIGEYSKEAV